MNLPAPPTGLYPEDYDRIEAAVMETVRGRWFLLEYARRQRAAETERLVQAVDRLERYVATRVEDQRETPEAEPARDWRLPQRLAERAREFAHTLRASGLDESFCAQADALAEQFAAYAAAAAREAAPSPVEPESGIIVEIVGAPEVFATDLAHDEAEWSEDIAAEAQAVEHAEPPEPAKAKPIVVDPRLAALSRLDHLSLHEKLRLFG
ncbi:hypothetical protein [Methylosinus sp. Sm6]|uniref:hypothetical protein n=1 Tax=Methylosinus sp. Sm6 TaxID=2866948 RepID=UPI001C9A0A8E|nr:hypothetical protein [Methylosinus sp. Sm6]MBY6240712.1 hypothetical protein [Methylosinus sp. Sm6]